MSDLTLKNVLAGADLMEALRELPESGWAQGNGQVEGVEIRVAGEAVDPTRSLRGRLTLVSLQGPSGGPFTVTLARATDAGLELLGGALVKARSAGVTLAFTSALQAAPEKGPPRREVVPDGNRPATHHAGQMSPPDKPPPKPAPEPEPQKTWADVAAASDEATDGPSTDDDGEPIPTQGDLVDHFSFGLCEVLMSDGDRLRVRDVKGPGRIREVALAALKVMPPTRQNGKRTFRLLRRS